MSAGVRIDPPAPAPFECVACQRPMGPRDIRSCLTPGYYCVAGRNVDYVPPLAERLVAEVAAGLGVLNVERVGIGRTYVSEELITERARNIVAGLLANYRIEAL